MKVHLPIVGKATGSSAGLIYQSYWGNTYTRSFPFSFHYPDTQEQQKTQASFFAIQRAWWAIYPQLATFIPKSQRRNRNIFNTLSKGIYYSMLTYKEKSESNVKKIFGLDARKQVKLNIYFSRVKIDGNTCSLEFNILSITSIRKFEPKKFHVLLYNIERQEFFYYYDDYKSSSLIVNFNIPNDWSYEDIVVGYLALSDENFFTNFYLCGR